MRPINLLFTLSTTYWLRYDEYILYVQREKKNYIKTAMKSTITIFILLVGFQIVNSDEIKEFRIPYSYLGQILALEFQVEIMFLFKVLVFPFFFCLHKLMMAIDQCCCGGRCYTIKRSISEDLEISVTNEHVQYYESNYMCACNYKLAEFFHPFKQWLHLMLKDYNPHIQYMKCQLCNESFNLFERIVLPLECKARNAEGD